jgi:hypothetical protein
MSNDRDVWEDPEHDWSEFDEDDSELGRPNRHRWIAWVLVAALAIAPLYTLLSVLQIAPALVIVVAGFSIAAVYFVRASRSDVRDRDDG